MDFNRYIATGEFAALADWFRSDGEVVHYAAGDRFARQGCRNRHCGVVGRGAFRYVHLARSGERHVVGYAFAGEFVGDYVAMCGDRPSQVSIEAMCDCTVWRADDDRSFLSGRSGVRTAGAPAGRTSDLRTLRTDVAALCLYAAGALRDAVAALSGAAEHRCVEGAGLLSARTARNAESHSRPRAVRN